MGDRGNRDEREDERVRGDNNVNPYAAGAAVAGVLLAGFAFYQMRGGSAEASPCQLCSQHQGTHLPRVPAPPDDRCSNERQLQAYLCERLVVAGANIVTQEWHVVSGRTDLGVGDVVAKAPCGTHMVIEVKYLDMTATGPTARARRTEQRGKVKEQAEQYANAWLESGKARGQRIVSATYTNERGLEYCQFHDNANDSYQEDGDDDF